MGLGVGGHEYGAARLRASSSFAQTLIVYSAHTGGAHCKHTHAHTLGEAYVYRQAQQLKEVLGRACISMIGVRQFFF